MDQKGGGSSTKGSQAGNGRLHGISWYLDVLYEQGRVWSSRPPLNSILLKLRKLLRLSIEDLPDSLSLSQLTTPI